MVDVEREQRRLRDHLRYVANKEKWRLRDAARYVANAEKQRAYSRAYAKDHPEKARSRKQKYRANHPERVKLQKRIYNASHIEEAQLRSFMWREANLEKSRSICRAWYAANKARSLANSRNRRARKQAAPGTHSLADIEALYIAQHAKCLCGSDLGRKFHVDHIIPLSRGGRNDRQNLQLLCAPCNLSKGTKTMTEWCEVLKRRIGLLRCQSSLRGAA